MAAGHSQHPHPLALVVEEGPQTQEQVNAEDDQALQLEQSPTQDDRLEATELARLRSNYSRVSRRSNHTIAVMKPATFLGLLTYNIKKFWKNQVSISVDHEACRDHLGQASTGSRTASGQTFYTLRRKQTALTISISARTNIPWLPADVLGPIDDGDHCRSTLHNPTPNPHFGFFVLGKPLSCVCQGAAIYTLVIGCFRTWRSQNAIVRGKAISGGFEIVALAVGIFLILTSLLLMLLFFILLITVDVLKEDLA
ncbi:hypothetical protein LSUB1_G003206 [Lachnellula subtilissima]|uniref:Uncharacterized protein n=1 Tax=Lachnellula subtilissima TaxID=602034 RepID=A0A8H8RXW6_9HELO|nr:hypothetical protein LSUB1_G003206 [Lachnellula subtilissima]